jgi:hypothetical protein
MCPRAGLYRCEKSRPQRDSIPRPTSPQQVDTPTELTRPTEINVKVKQSRYRPAVAQRVPGNKDTRFHDNDTGWW